MKHEIFTPRSPQARLDVPPHADQRATLPGDFGRRFVIFGDAEEEFDWSAPLARENTATGAIASLPEATQRFNDHGAIPCYLVDYPVVDNAHSAEIIGEMVANATCVVGAQLHPWVNPPFDEEVNNYNSFTGNLPRSLQRAKLQALTAKIAQATGHRPVIYRAGRYGIGEHSADLLIEAGYRLDVSVRALFDYSASGGPDFSHHPVWPWLVGGALWEVPLTASWVGKLRKLPALHKTPSLRGPLARLDLLSRMALTPEDMPLPETLEAIRILLGEGHQLFSLSFHTPTIGIGNTPYVRDASDLKRFWAWWTGVFDLFAREDVQPTCAYEIIDALDHG